MFLCKQTVSLSYPLFARSDFSPVNLQTYPALLWVSESFPLLQIGALSLCLSLEYLLSLLRHLYMTFSMMLWPSIAKPCGVNFLVECCSFVAELFLPVYPFLYAVFYFSLPNDSLAYLGCLQSLGWKSWGSPYWQCMLVSLHLSMRVLCLLKQLQHRRYTWITHVYAEMVRSCSLCSCKLFYRLPESSSLTQGCRSSFPNYVNENLLDKQEFSLPGGLSFL